MNGTEVRYPDSIESEFIHTDLKDIQILAQFHVKPQSYSWFFTCKIHRWILKADNFLKILYYMKKMLRSPIQRCYFDASLSWRSASKGRVLLKLLGSTLWPFENRGFLLTLCIVSFFLRLPQNLCGVTQNGCRNAFMLPLRLDRASNLVGWKLMLVWITTCWVLATVFRKITVIFVFMLYQPFSSMEIY